MEVFTILFQDVRIPLRVATKSGTPWDQAIFALDIIKTPATSRFINLEDHNGSDHAIFLRLAPESLHNAHQYMYVQKALSNVLRMLNL